MTALAPAIPPQRLWHLKSSGDVRLTPHPGQARVWKSRKRFIVALAGKQGGKTTLAPWWLAREIQACGPGDYIAGTATYDLFKLKFLPALRECFEHVLGIGRYWSGDRIIELADQDEQSPTFGQFLAKRADDPMWARIILRSADSATGWASATANGGVLDEAGEEHYTLAVWEEAQARVALRQGRLLLPTTIYDMGWLKTALYDPWEKAGRQHPEIDIIQFDSTDNPAFPREEFERLRGSMPRWRFDMHYRGVYTRPAGMIYDVFDRATHTCPPFALPDTWQRYCGLDFGGVNTAAVFLAEEPGTKKLYCYRTYHHGGRTGKEHGTALLAGEAMIPFCVGGSPSEGQWRQEFRMGGLPVNAPDIKEVEIGIDRVYGTMKRGELIIFDTLTELLGEIESYSRPVDDAGNVLPGIVNKAMYHNLDALRYIVGRIRRGV